MVISVQLLSPQHWKEGDPLVQGRLLAASQFTMGEPRGKGRLASAPKRSSVYGYILVGDILRRFSPYKSTSKQPH